MKILNRRHSYFPIKKDIYKYILSIFILFLINSKLGNLYNYDISIIIKLIK